MIALEDDNVTVLHTYEDLIREQLEMLSHDTEVDGMHETPQRVARVHMEHLNCSADPTADAASLQERITSETAEVMMSLKPVGVPVDMAAEHTCMRVRGVRDACSSTRTRLVMGQSGKTRTRTTRRSRCWTDRSMETIWPWRDSSQEIVVST